MFRHFLFVHRTIRRCIHGKILRVLWRNTLAVFSFALASIFLFDGNAMAQRGEGPWEEVLPIGRVDKSLRAYLHFEDKDKNYWESPWKAAGSVRHFVEGYSYDPITKAETFITFESPDNHRRVEFRGPDYETGTYQFEGELLIKDNITDDVWVLQLWHAALVKYRNNGGTGTLAYHSANDATGEARVGVKEIANNIRGKRVRLNLIHTGAPSFDLVRHPVLIWG